MATHNSSRDDKTMESPTVWAWVTGEGDPIKATMRLDVALSIVVIISAGVLGFTALRDLFISIGLFISDFIRCRRIHVCCFNVERPTSG